MIDYRPVDKIVCLRASQIS